MQTASRVFDKKRRFQRASDRPVFVQTNEISPSAGVSARALQLAFRRFGDTTPMAHLRALRLDFARNKLARARGTAVRSPRSRMRTASAPSADSRQNTKARFHEQPSEMRRRGGVGR
jgi:transcriptional regulator GlxA family with amidase domain